MSSCVGQCSWLDVVALVPDLLFSTCYGIIKLVLSTLCIHLIGHYLRLDRKWIGEFIFRDNNIVLYTLYHVAEVDLSYLKQVRDASGYHWDSLRSIYETWETQDWHLPEEAKGKKRLASTIGLQQKNKPDGSGDSRLNFHWNWSKSACSEEANVGFFKEKQPGESYKGPYWDDLTPRVKWHPKLIRKRGIF